MDERGADDSQDLHRPRPDLRRRTRFGRFVRRSPRIRLFVNLITIGSVTASGAIGTLLGANTSSRFLWVLFVITAAVGLVGSIFSVVVSHLLEVSERQFRAQDRLTSILVRATRLRSAIFAQMIKLWRAKPPTGGLDDAIAARQQRVLELAGEHMKRYFGLEADEVLLVWSTPNDDASELVQQVVHPDPPAGWTCERVSLATAKPGPAYAFKNHKANAIVESYAEVFPGSNSFRFAFSIPVLHADGARATCVGVMTAHFQHQGRYFPATNEALERDLTDHAYFLGLLDAMRPTAKPAPARG